MRTSHETPVAVWGLNLTPWTLARVLDEVDALIESGGNHYFITANVHYAMLSWKNRQLECLNNSAAFLVADGMPLVWASRWKSKQLPARVAGADLFPALCARAAERGYRVFFLGGAAGVGEEAARRLLERNPDLQIVGIEAPPFRVSSVEENEALVNRIWNARPDLLFVAYGQPKGELWIAENLAQLNVPISVQIGASLDFMAGVVPRAPRWLQRVGMEWIYRLYQEPSRLLCRYWRNGCFVVKMLFRDLLFRRTIEGSVCAIHEVAN